MGSQGPVWATAKNLAPTRTRSPDRPARSKSIPAPRRIETTLKPVHNCISSSSIETLSAELYLPCTAHILHYSRTLARMLRVPARSYYSRTTGELTIKKGRHVSDIIVENWKRQYSAPNNSKHSPPSICS